MIRVLLAGGHFLFRQAVRAALESEGDILVVGEAADETEAIGSVDRALDVVVVDAAITEGNIAATVERVADALPRAGVVFIATVADEPPLADVIAAGARAYLSKEAALADLIGSVRAVSRGEVVIPQPLVGSLVTDLLDRQRYQREAFAVLERLTRRERQVLVLVGADLDNRTIARSLEISEGTARTHVQTVLGKLGVHSRTEAAAFARRTDLLRTRQGAPTGDPIGARDRSIGSLTVANAAADSGLPPRAPLDVGATDGAGLARRTEGSVIP